MPSGPERQAFMRGKIGRVRGASTGNVVPAEHCTRGAAAPSRRVPQLRPSASRLGGFFAGIHPAACFPLHTKKWPLSAAVAAAAATVTKWRTRAGRRGGARQQVSPPPPPPSSAARARLTLDTKEPLGLCFPPHAWDAPGGGLEALEPLPESSPRCLRDLKRGGAEELEAGLGPSLGLGAPEGRD